MDATNVGTPSGIMWFVDVLGALPPSERELYDAACRDDEIAFGHLVAPYRGELHAQYLSHERYSSSLLNASSGLCDCASHHTTPSTSVRVSRAICINLC